MSNDPGVRRGGGRENRLPLADRACLVIGTAGSLAALIAGEATERGARVALATKDPPDDRIANAWASFRSDSDSEAEIDRLYDAVLESLARLDVVIVVLEAQALPPVHNLPLEHWRQHVITPLRKGFWLAQRALDEFVACGNGGRLIFVVGAPDAETVIDPTGVIVEAFASLARSVAREYGRRAVSCHVVVQASSVEQAPSAGDRYRPVVECALFLASSAAAFVTGETVVVGAPGKPLISASSR